MLVDLVDESRARQMSHAPNVRAIRARRTKRIVRLIVTAHGSDYSLNSRHGNPRRYSHDHETEQNPARCWTLRHLPKEANPALYIQDLIST